MCLALWGGEVSGEMRKLRAVSSRKLHPVGKAGAYATGGEVSKPSRSQVSKRTEANRALNKGNTGEAAAEEAQLSWSFKVSRRLIESLYCTPGSNITLHVKYTGIKIK